ncbi:MAG: DUF1932 domain-containing protein [Pseudomonadota bacterium]
MRIGVFGLGEAGGLIAADLARAGLQVKAYDPADVTTPDDVIRCDSAASAVVDAHIVTALTSAADAEGALHQAYDDIPAEAIYADFSTAAASLKKKLENKASKRHLAFVDVALLAVVPGNGLRTRALASGPGADRFVDVFRSLGMPIESLAGKAGEAATRKLLRSVFMKGLAGVMIEALQAADKADLTEWLWENLTAEIACADESLVRRLVTGTGPHARRRLHEMEASAQLLKDLGVDPVMTRGTVENLRRVLTVGLPPIPDPTL